MNSQNATLLRLHLLTLNAIPAAAIFAIAAHGTLYCYLTAYDPQFTKLSPGAILLGTRYRIRESRRPHRSRLPPRRRTLQVSLGRQRPHYLPCAPRNEYRRIEGATNVVITDIATITPYTGCAITPNPTPILSPPPSPLHLAESCRFRCAKLRAYPNGSPPIRSQSPSTQSPQQQSRPSISACFCGGR